MDHLRKALAGALGTDPTPAAEPPSLLPDPLKSEWGAALRHFGVSVPDRPTLGQIVQRSDAASRAMEAGGRKRDASDLRKVKEQYLKDREKEAWALVKARFADLVLSEKAYRALKQEGALPEKVLEGIIGQIPVGRLGSGEEIADTVSFLAGERAAYVTGTTLSLNGGQYLVG